MARLGQAMIDGVLRTGELEGVGPEDLAPFDRLLDLGDGRLLVSWGVDFGCIVGF